MNRYYYLCKYAGNGMLDRLPKPTGPDVTSQGGFEIDDSPSTRQLTKSLHARYLPLALGAAGGFGTYALLRNRIKNKTLRGLLSGAAGLGTAYYSNKIIDPLGKILAPDIYKDND